jgi:hypothetical protein
MPAYDVGGPSSKTRTGSVENEHETFRRYNIQKPVSAGMDKVETTGKDIPGQGYVMGEICQTKNPLPLHPRRDRDDTRICDK